MAHNQRKRHLPGGMQALVSDQVDLTNFWSDWQQQQRHFLSSSIKAGAKQAGRDNGLGQGTLSKRDSEVPDDASDGPDSAEELAALLEDPILEREGPVNDACGLSPSPAAQEVARYSAESGEVVPVPFGVASGGNLAASVHRGSSTDGRSATGDMVPSPQQGSNGGGERAVSTSSRPTSTGEEDDRMVLLRRIAELESRLVETESFMNSEPGALIQDLESTLAETKLRLADIEAEKDEMEMQLMNLQAKSSKGKENGVPSSLWFGNARTN